MGLNVNYSLLIEGNNSTSYIPEYKNYYKPGFFMQSELAACISEFNQELRESREFLSNLYEVESVNESTAAVNIVNGIKFVADKVKKAIIKVMGVIIDGIKKAIDAMEKFSSYAKSKIDMKIRPNERIDILKRILANADIDELRQRATPRDSKAISVGQANRIKSMSASGNYTISEIAKQLGLSPTTVKKYLKGVD